MAACKLFPLLPTMMHAVAGVQTANFSCFADQVAFAAKSRMVSKVSVGVKEDPKVTWAMAPTCFEVSKMPKTGFNMKMAIF